MQRTEVDEARREIAATLAKHYSEIASIVPDDGPPFNLSRLLLGMAGDLRLEGTREDEVTSLASTLTGAFANPYRRQIPWSVFTGKRAMATTPGASGGFAVGSAIGAAAQALRRWSITARAGVEMLENLTDNVVLPRIATETTGAWVGENAAGSPVDPVVGNVTLSPRTFIATIPISLQLLRQSEVADRVVRDMLLRAAGRALDAAVLAGAGGAEPQGLLSQVTVTESGTSLGWTGIANLRETLANADVDDERVTFVAAPGVRELLEKREVATGNGGMVWSGATIAGRPAVATAQMPAATLLAGDFSTVAVGMFGPGLRVDVDPSGTGFNNASVTVRVLMMADVALRQPSAFVKSTSIT